MYLHVQYTIASNMWPNPIFCTVLKEGSVTHVDSIQNQRSSSKKTNISHRLGLQYDSIQHIQTVLFTIGAAPCPCMFTKAD